MENNEKFNFFLKAFNRLTNDERDFLIDKLQKMNSPERTVIYNGISCKIIKAWPTFIFDLESVEDATIFSKVDGYQINFLL